MADLEKHLDERCPGWNAHRQHKGVCERVAKLECLVDALIETLVQITDDLGAIYHTIQGTTWRNKEI